MLIRHLPDGKCSEWNMKPRGGSLPQCMLYCIFKALFMNESTLIVRYKQKLFMVGTGLIFRMFVIIFFLASRRLVPVFKALYMARP